MKQLDPCNPNHILIGLGGTGGKVLKAFRKRLWEEFPKSEDRRKLSIGFVYVDSTDEMIKPRDPSWKVFGQNAQFGESEFVNIKTADLDMILNNPELFPGLKHIVKNGEMMRNAIGEVGAAVGQKRRAGRIFFAANISKYLAAVKNQYEKVTSVSGKKVGCHIHIFTGLAGGTGSGSIIDAVAQLRADDTFKWNTAEITVYAMVPGTDFPTGHNIRENAYAALCELSALNVGVFLPCDVKTGAKHVNIDTRLFKQFGLMVYSNVNENGIEVNSFTELPELLADMVFFLLFASPSYGYYVLQRSLSFHGLCDYLIEYNALNRKSSWYDKERARTKAVCSFGIKRIVYPERRLVEHICYTLADSVFKQMLYNNYKDDLGFITDPPKEDYELLNIKDHGQRRKWMLDDSFFMLNERILDTDRKFEKIEDFWKNLSFSCNYDDAKNADSNLLNCLEQFFHDTYKKAFRIHKQGVEEYYCDKCKEDVLRTQAEHILETLEQDLYTQWYEGRLGLNDLIHICDIVLDYIKERCNEVPESINAYEVKIANLEQELTCNMNEYTHLNLLQKVIGRQSQVCYVKHQAILTNLYTAKTELVAMDFAARLLSKLQILFKDFQNQVQMFVEALAQCVEEAAKRISDRNQPRGSLRDMNQAVIEICNDAKVADFEKSLLLDHNRMENIASILRHELMGNKTCAHFDELTKSLTIEKVFEVVDKVMDQQVRDIHDVECTKDKLIGINLLQLLQKILITDDDIRAFTKNAVDNSGVFILLDDTELQKTLNNNPNPVAYPETINRKTILVTLPSPEGDDTLKELAKKLEYSFRSAFGNVTPGRIIDFATSDETNNEITIAVVKSVFPLRALKWLPEYERAYKMLTESSYKAEARNARIFLHSEGNGTCLPPIMGEKILTAQEFVPYLFLGAAIGMLNVVDDEESGRSGWYLTREGDWGITTNSFMARKFTDLPFSELMTAECRDEILDKVNEVLKDTELLMTKRAEFDQQIECVMREYVIKECSDTDSTMLQQFRDDAERAREILQKDD